MTLLAYKKKSVCEPNAFESNENLMSLRNEEGAVTGMLEWLEWLACLHGWRG